MKCIVGLGNPGPRYATSRHNVGFMAVDQLAEKWGTSIQKEKFQGLYATCVVNQEKVLLCKPLTYMNLSGECVGPLLHYFDIAIDDLVVIYDDLDLSVGRLRLREKGSAGGHNGMKSIIQHLGTSDFKRIKIGIGRPQFGDVKDYVLQPFFPEDREQISSAISNAVEAVQVWLQNDFISAMNRYNGKG
ncbi:aminoacyl-tRNA hydrolase [Rubeoparvulum massiliense]|uniref:aminoacyl-tRNA hydrolase n=1 Tax=Rubeoparvulum massiliense TaxID=1631346 RepID=UPI00065DE772|nr:aminoacyl-tRNA hydrolase [Rubeoparvulum massiliense]